jgi:hypothetical protein
MKRLIILDLNGVLCDRLYKPKLSKDDKGTRLGEFLTWPRPGLEDFMTRLTDNYDVAIWSSMERVNTYNIINSYLHPYISCKFKFIWDQSMCTNIGVHPTQPQKHLYLKELSKVWKEYLEYDQTNTILVDDSSLKCRNNPLNTSIHPTTWSRDMVDDDGLDDIILNVQQNFLHRHERRTSITS